MQARHSKFLGLLSLLGLLGSCGGTIGGNPEKSGSGIQFSITDAPVDDAQHVYITIESIAVKKEAEDWLTIPLSETEEIDLLSLQHGRSKAFAALETLPEGVYTETRLVLSESSPPRLVDKEGVEHALKVPSGSESGLKIKSSFIIQADVLSEVTIDFDLRKSLKLNGNGNGNGNGQSDKYQLIPVLRLAENRLTGSMSGQAPVDTLICAFESGTPIESSCDEAVSTAKANSEGFTLAFLPAAHYSVALYQDGVLLGKKENVEVKAQEVTAVGQLP